MGVKTFGIVGAGTMGSGIAQVAAVSGFDVILADVNDECLERGMAGINKSLKRFVDKGKMSAEDKETAVQRIKTGTDLNMFSEADLVVEAVFEKEEVKREIFKKLDEVTAKEVILGTNTSSISITKIGAVTGKADKVIGMHFMNPVPLMKLVEVIRGLATSDDTFQQTVEVAKKMGKIPVEVNDAPGFVANRLLMPMVNEAAFALMEGVGKAENIDSVMKLGMNHPMGPLALADLIGLDVCLDIMRVLHRELGDDKYRPCPLLVKKVEAGYLGKKSGIGFYDYKE